MQRKGVFFPIFLIFLFLIGLIFLFSQTRIFRNVGGFFESVTMPVQQFTFGLFNNHNKTTEDKLREENAKLFTELARQKEIENENKALHDQFAISNPSSEILLPAKIIGRHDNEIVLDKGERDGVSFGQIVVFKDNIIGVVSYTSINRAVVRFLTNDKISFTAKTVKTGASGVVSGKGGDEILLDKVVLSETLEKDDIVVTKGDIDSKGKGFKADLVVGKIVSINKKASNLFQSAEIVSLIDFYKLETVFVMISDQ